MRLLLFPVALALVSQQLPLGELPLVPPSIRSRWAEDVRSKNLNDVLSLYTSGAVLVNPDGSSASTGSDLRKHFETVFAAYDSDITLEQPRHHETGTPRHPTSIIDEGTYSEARRDRSTGVSERHCGRYTFTYVKPGDSITGWRVSRMEWTEDPCPISVQLTP